MESPSLKQRLDSLLVARGLFPSRTRAQAAIRAGLVRVDGAAVTAPSAAICADDDIAVDGDVHDYVSRGGVKLAAGLDAFGFSPEGRVCVDLGASTGGFTDVLLRRAAARVYAVDVGTDQLHPRLAADGRVVRMEQTDARRLDRTAVPEPVGAVTADVSFISLRKVLAPALALAGEGAFLVALVKPQFELGREHLGKGGLVKADAATIDAMLDRIATFLEDQRWRVRGRIQSPIAGGDGNLEQLIGATRDP